VRATHGAWVLSKVTQKTSTGELSGILVNQQFKSRWSHQKRVAGAAPLRFSRVRVLKSLTIEWLKLRPHYFSHAPFRAYNPSMSDTDHLAGIVPRRVHPRIDGETAVTEHIEKIEGEVALDSYVRAQTSAPQVVKRINELENSLQRVANTALALSDIARHPELRAAAEEAKLVLKNRLEVDNTKHQFHSELGVFKDDLRIIKD
jgi:hypothetical protein